MDKAELERYIDKTAERIVGQMGRGTIGRRLPFGGTYDADQNQGFKSFGEFLHSVKFNPGDARLKALSEGSDPGGGFLVPQQMWEAILLDTVERAVVRPYATILPMSSDTLNVPRVLDTSHASSTYGGIIAYWTEEAGDKTEVEPTFGNIKLTAKKLTGYTQCSNELLADSAIALGVLLQKLFAGALGWYEDSAFINGDGVGKPLGWMNSGALISVTRNTLLSLVIQDLAGMWARLLPQSTSRAIWLANPDCIGQLAQLATTSLTWLSSDQGLAKAPPARLLGRPLYLTEHMAALGTTGDIALVDLSYYLIGDRQKFQVDMSEHVRFKNDETVWRFVERVDGQPWVDEVFTPEHGATLSPFVVLTTATS